jgi:hypothetical protein
MHYDSESAEEVVLDLKGDLANLSKDKLIRCLLNLELFNTCYLSRAWINCTLVFRNRIEYGDLYMANRLLVRNAVELLLCTLGGELSWPMINPDTTKEGFIKVTEPGIVVKIFKDRLVKITQGTPDERVVQLHRNLGPDVEEPHEHVGYESKETGKRSGRR